MDLLLLLNRVALGWYVLNAGWEKVREELGAGLGAFLLDEGFRRRSEILPDMLVPAFGYSWPWIEAICGAVLMIGLFGRVTAAVTTWVLLSIAIALLFAGDFLPRHHLMVFVPASMLLVALGPGRFSVDGMWRAQKV
jgi:uncharacterized membrane protein YphA (DoxX/SURF4 family)